MEQKEFTSGSRKVIATRNDEASQWNARLYVNKGETATLVSGKFKTTPKMEAWAKTVLAR